MYYVSCILYSVYNVVYIMYIFILYSIMWYYLHISTLYTVYVSVEHGLGDVRVQVAHVERGELGHGTCFRAFTWHLRGF